MSESEYRFRHSCCLSQNRRKRHTRRKWFPLNTHRLSSTQYKPSCRFESRYHTSLTYKLTQNIPDSSSRFHRSYFHCQSPRTSRNFRTVQQDKSCPHWHSAPHTDHWWAHKQCLNRSYQQRTRHQEKKQVPVSKLQVPLKRHGSGGVKQSASLLHPTGVASIGIPASTAKGRESGNTTGINSRAGICIRGIGCPTDVVRTASHPARDNRLRWNSSSSQDVQG